MQKLNLNVSKVQVIHSDNKCDKIIITIDDKESPYRGWEEDLTLEFTCANGDAERYLKENLNLVADEIIDIPPNDYKFSEKL